MKPLDTGERSSQSKGSRKSLRSQIHHKYLPVKVTSHQDKQQVIVDQLKLNKHSWADYLLILPSFGWLINRKLGFIEIGEEVNRPKSFIFPLFVGILLWFIPSPEGVNEQAWHLLAIFLATIIGFITKPLPIGAVAVIALTVSVITDTLTIEQGLSGFSHKTAWLTVCSFLVARAIIKTGLGTRIAYLFITIFGKNTLLLSYGLLITDLILSPVMPSGNARGGGVIFPIVKSLATAFDSEPYDGTERKIGSFLMTTAYQGTQITTALFLTAMVANPLMAQLADEIAGVQIDWITWALAALLPGVISLIAMPLIVYWFYPPQLRSTPDAPQIAQDKLKKMGKIRPSEWSMIVIFIVLLVLWGWGNQLWGIESVTTSLIGVILLLATGVLTWKDITQEQKAWDIFIWFSILLMMATFLSQFGFIGWVSNVIGSAIENLWWQVAFACLSLVYFYSNYFFASKAARASAMFPAFLSVAISLGTPPMYAALVLAFLINLSGCLTHYGTAEAPIYFGAGYVDAATWCILGFYLSLAYLIIWTLLGGWWWHLLGLV
ncbi:anion permease [Pleurocapsa sp. PCC 7319]|uniref:anion permease n=1 Tax=Pleurocapsa sp. PCC 7319 TaxID=118161 RepID=UPI000371C798|nr:anion permease [Pleurocapsa sp. PCC 7319]